MRYYTTLTLLITCMVIGLTGCRRDGIPTGGEGNTTEESKQTDLRILEVYYAGSEYSRVVDGQRYPSEYTDDAFIKIYNPTKEVKYLDGMLIATGSLDPAANIEVTATDGSSSGTADYYLKNFLVGSMLLFPGSGTEHPVQPGTAVIIAQKAVDHKVACAKYLAEYGEDVGAYDLSKLLDLHQAKYSWTEGSGEIWVHEVFNAGGIESPKEAANAWDSEEMNDFSISGKTALALIRPTVEISKIREAFLQECKLPASDREKAVYYRDVYFKSTHHSSRKVGLLLPNDQVIDAVVICPMKEKKMQILNLSLDKGFHGVQQSSGDGRATYAGKSIVRKWDGKGFVDENNSTSDFEVKPVNPTTTIIRD